MNLEQYEARLRLLPCCVCVALGEVPPTQAQALHHAFEAIFRDDWLQVPICYRHHQGAEGIHTLQRRGFFKEKDLSDMALTRTTIRLFARSLA